MLEEVTIVAFGKQKKESVISSIQTVHVKDLRVPSSNLTTALSGRIAGVISYQTSGEPGQDNAEFFIRCLLYPSEVYRESTGLLISLSRMSPISLPTARNTGYSMAFCSSSLPRVKVIIMPMDMQRNRHEK